jgi:hypothetical protein
MQSLTGCTDKVDMTPYATSSNSNFIRGLVSEGQGEGPVRYSKSLPKPENEKSKIEIERIAR